MIRYLPILAAVVALSACQTPTNPIAVAAIGDATTLAGVAAANNTTVAQIVSDGQLFCSGASGIFAVLSGLTSPTSVVGKAAPVVANVCKSVDAIAVPVSPPDAAAAVPVVVVPGALAKS
jgi:hypothetical protein